MSDFKFRHGDTLSWSQDRRHFLAAGLGLAVAPLWTQVKADGRGSIHSGVQMEIQRSGTQASKKGPAEWFTGTVRIDPLFSAHPPARTVGAYVTFEPGARTAWHTHPLGQTLIVTAGCGWVQREGGAVAEVHPGDVVWFPPGEKHWHGAAASTAMTHIAITEELEGKAVDWLEHVSVEQYRK